MKKIFYSRYYCTVAITMVNIIITKYHNHPTPTFLSFYSIEILQLSKYSLFLINYNQMPIQIFLIYNLKK